MCSHRKKAKKLPTSRTPASRLARLVLVSVLVALVAAFVIWQRETPETATGASQPETATGAAQAEKSMCTLQIIAIQDVYDSPRRHLNVQELTSNSTRCFVLSGLVGSWGGATKWERSFLEAAGLSSSADSTDPTIDGNALERSQELRDDCPREVFDLLLDENYFFSRYEWDGIAKRRYLIVGREGQGGSLHVDPFREGFWHAHLRGAKRWMMLPPARKEWVKQNLNLAIETMPASEFFASVAPSLRSHRFHDVVLLTTYYLLRTTYYYLLLRTTTYYYLLHTTYYIDQVASLP